MALRPRPTAIVAASDYVAMGVLHSLTAMGYRVPEDMSAVDFHNILLH